MNRRHFLATGLASLVVLPRLVGGARAIGPQQKVALLRVQYDGHWDVNSGALEVLSEETRLRTSTDVATLGVLIFSVQLGWFDVLGWGGPSWSEFYNPFAWDFRKVVLPVLSLGLLPAAYVARITRASMLEVLSQDYIRTARAKGVREYVVVLRHAVKNALIPVLTVAGPIFAILITGSFIVERIFQIPGIGRPFVDAVFRRDYGVIMGTTIFFATIVAFANLIVDILYAVVDPRIRYG